MVFKFLDHTADIGIFVESFDFKSALEESIKALILLIFGELIENDIYEVNNGTVEIQSNDKESLLVDFLNEILFLIDSKKIIPLKLEILEICNNGLKAKYLAYPINYEKNPIRLYVKAVTFHQLEIEEKENQTTIKFFVDI